jgi:hypothetical protein
VLKFSPMVNYQQKIYNVSRGPHYQEIKDLKIKKEEKEKDTSGINLNTISRCSN